MAISLSALVMLATASPASAAFGFLTEWGSLGTDAGEFAYPVGVTTRAGTVYVADNGNDRIQTFTPAGAFVGQFGGTGTAEGQLSFPHDVTIDTAGNIYVTDDGNRRVEKFTSSGTFLRAWGKDVISGNAETGFEVCTGSCKKGEFDSSGGGGFSNPLGIDTDSAGNVWVADESNDAVQKYKANGQFQGLFSGSGAGEGLFDGPAGLAIDASHDDVMYVVDFSNHRVQKFNSNGDFLRMWGWGVRDGSDEFQICTAGCQQGIAGSGAGQFSSPTGVDTDPAGNVYVADRSNNRIEKFSPSGAFLGQFGTGGTGTGQFNQPEWVGTDTAGNVYVSDSQNHRIQKFGEPPSAGPPSPPEGGGSAPVEPSNEFTFGELEGKILDVEVPGPGTVEATDAADLSARQVSAAAKKRLKPSSATAHAAGTVHVKLKLKKKAKKKLKKKGKVKVNAAITFTPTGGDPNTETVKLKVKTAGSEPD